MKDLYSLILESLKQGRTSALATIIKQAGPSPRGIGAKCLIFEDGSIAGTIGGGLLEGQTLKEAGKVFEKGIPLRLSFYLKGTDVAQTDMLCGGEVDVFIEPLWPGNAHVDPPLSEAVGGEQPGRGRMACDGCGNGSVGRKASPTNSILTKTASRSGPFRAERDWKRAF